MNAAGHFHVVAPAGLHDPRHPSGGNVYDRRVCDGLVAAGWRVCEHEVPGRWPAADEAAREALAGVLRSAPDGSPVLVDGLVGCAAPQPLVAAADRLRVVVLVHMPLGTDPRRRSDELAALTAARAVVTTSDWTRRWLEETYAPGVPVRVAAPGADPAEPALGSPGGGELLCVAAVTPHKGHDVLVSALATLTDLRWRCTVAGALDLAPEHAARVRREVERHGLDGRVTFTGPLTGPALQRAYASADLLVLASRAETFGMVVGEALAHALPVVASRVGGVPEAMGVVDGQLPGRLVEPDDPASLASALRTWLDDEDERAALRVAALARRRSLPTWSATAARVAGVLGEVAGGPRD